MDTRILIGKLGAKFDINRKLSPNFSLREMLFGTGDRLLKSLSGEEQLIFLETMLETLNEDIIQELTKLCFLLEIIRAYIGEPLVVTCGYRSVNWELHKGRSGNSKHVFGMAADITFNNANLHFVYDWIEKNIRIGGRGINFDLNFIHIDTRPNYAEWDY